MQVAGDGKSWMANACRRSTGAPKAIGTSKARLNVSDRECPLPQAEQTSVWIARKSDTHPNADKGQPAAVWAITDVLIA